MHENYSCADRTLLFQHLDLLGSATRCSVLCTEDD